jgi:hypothetical protein
MIKTICNIFLGVPLLLGKEIMENLLDEVDKERLITEESIKEKLQQSQLMLQNSEISEKEYDEIEAMLIERLRAVREYRKDGHE